MPNGSRVVRIVVLASAACLFVASWLTVGSSARSGAGPQRLTERRATLTVSGEWYQPQQTKSAAPEKKAEEVYKSIQTFKGLPASVVMGAMEKISGFLGVDCDHCHVMGEFEKEDKAQKEQTRMMFRMVRTIGRELNSSRVTCYTCHRGHARPDPVPADLQARSEEAMKKAGENRKPAGEAFKNIQMLKGATAGELTAIMSDFTAALGVDCTYCHDMGGFDRDSKPQKVAARRMLKMTGAVATEHFGGKTTVTCYTCHRGHLQPPSSAK
jgi:hypothetical protein